MSIKTFLEGRYRAFWRKNYSSFLGFTPIGIELGDFLPTFSGLKKGKGNYAFPKYKPINTELGERYYDFTFNKQDRFVFVGLNPSGANLNYYEYYFGKEENKDKKFEEHPDNAVIWYSPTAPDPYPTAPDPYLKAAKDFVKDCGYSFFYKLDTFCIVKKKQSDLVKHFLANQPLYQQMFEIFAETLIKIQPHVVVVTSAVIRKIFLKKGKFKGFQKIITCVPNQNKGGYTATITQGKRKIETQVYFSGMLSGQRALDKGSYENLVWLVSHY